MFYRKLKPLEVLPVTAHETLRPYLAKRPQVAPKRQGRAVARGLPSEVFRKHELRQAAHKGSRR